MVLVMTVEPGKGGQKLIPETLEKAKALSKIINEENLDVFSFQFFAGILLPYIVFSDFKFSFDYLDFSDLEKQIDIFLSFIKK